MDQFVIERGNGRIEEYYREPSYQPDFNPDQSCWTTQAREATRFPTRELAHERVISLRRIERVSIWIAQLLPSEV